MSAGCPVRRVTDGPNEMRKSRGRGWDATKAPSRHLPLICPASVINHEARNAIAFLSSCSSRIWRARAPVLSQPLRPSIAAFSLGSCMPGVLILAGVSSARAKDDNENSTPTAWWFYTGQSVAEIGATLTAKNARIVDIAPDNPAASSFTVTYAQNAGPYAKRWWWYVGVDAATLAKDLSANQARLISLKAYDIGRGNIRFAVAMISNSGADAKAWWYYCRAIGGADRRRWPSRITRGSSPCSPTRQTARPSIHAS